MAVITTGSLVDGLVDGLGNGVSSTFHDRIVGILGTPDAKLTAQVGSQVVVDMANSQYYMARAQGGSTWVKLGSVS